MTPRLRHFSIWSLTLIGCISLGLAACGENTPRKFAQGFRELHWHAPQKKLAGSTRQLHPNTPLFPFDATILVRDNEVRTLGHIPATQIAYAFTDDGLQAVRIAFSPDFLVPVRKYFEDSYGKPQKTSDWMRWEGYGVSIKLYPVSPVGPYVLIQGP